MTWDFSALQELLGLVFALIAMFASHKSAKRHGEVTQIAQSLSSERGKIEATAAAVESLADQLRALRGKFYAERRNSSEKVDAMPESAADLKARLRKQIGLKPGGL